MDDVVTRAALIDPSTKVTLETYVAKIEKHGAPLRYLIETHTHADHVSSAPEIALRPMRTLDAHHLPLPERLAHRLPQPSGEILLEVGER